MCCTLYVCLSYHFVLEHYHPPSSTFHLQCHKPIFKNITPTYSNFEELLQNSGVKDLVSEVGLIYPELVKTFYRNIKFSHDEFGDICMESFINNTKMSIGLEDISKCLGIPNKGYEFHIGFIPSEEWKDFDTLNYFVEISCGTRDDLIGRQSQSSRVIKYAKSLTVSDRMLHYVLAYILVPRHSNHAK